MEDTKRRQVEKVSFVLLTTLPSNVSNKLLLKPASDLVSAAA